MFSAEVGQLRKLSKLWWILTRAFCLLSSNSVLSAVQLPYCSLLPTSAASRSRDNLSVYEHKQNTSNTRYRYNKAMVHCLLHPGILITKDSPSRSTTHCWLGPLRSINKYTLEIASSSSSSSTSFRVTQVQKNFRAAVVSLSFRCGYGR